MHSIPCMEERVSMKTGVPHRLIALGLAAIHRWSRGYVISLSLCAFLTPQAFGQPKRTTPSASAREIVRLDGTKLTPNEISKKVALLMHDAGVTGLSIAVINNTHIVYLHSFGFRNIEKHLSMDTDTVMVGASFTKPAFAYMVLQLVDEGKLDLDKPVYQYLPKPLPEYPRYKDLAGDKRYQLITTRMILDHTTGFENWRQPQRTGKLSINFDPGSRFAYSGEGMDLLQLVVETVTGQPLSGLMEKRVFEPFGMRRSSMTWQSAFEADHAVGYSEIQSDLGLNGWDGNFSELPIPERGADAASSLFTTISDYALFVQGVMHGDELSEATWHEMLSPQIRIHSKHEFPSLSADVTNENDDIELSYGLGWGVFRSPLGPVFFKEGHDNGWYNHAVVYQRSGTGVILMSNSQNAIGIYRNLLEFLISDHYTPWVWERYCDVRSASSCSDE